MPLGASRLNFLSKTLGPAVEYLDAVALGSPASLSYYSDTSITNTLIDNPYFTLSAWVKPTLTGHTSSRWSPFALYASGAGAIVFVSIQDDGDIRFYGVGVEDYTWTGAISTADQWYHMLLVVDGINQTAKLYINGSEVSGTPSVNAANFNYDGVGEVYVGGITSGQAEGDEITQVWFSQTLVDDIDAFYDTTNDQAISLGASGTATGLNQPAVYHVGDSTDFVTTNGDTSLLNYTLSLTGTSATSSQGPEYNNSYSYTSSSEVVYVEQRTAGTITAFGTSQISTAQYKFGGSSLLLDGNSDYLETSGNVGDAIGDGDYTAECWIRYDTVPPSGSSFSKILDNRRATFGNFGWLLYTDGSSYIVQYRGSGAVTNNIINQPATINTNTWYHLALVKNGTTLYLYVDGTELGNVSVANTTYEDCGEDLWIGVGHNGADYVDGYIDEVRISNTARYTTGFTPSTTPFVNDSDTLLLLHADGTDGDTVFIDDNGDRAPVGIQAFNGAAIDTADKAVGNSSIYFDRSSSQWLETGNDIPGFGSTDDFTYECWFNYDSITSPQFLFGNRNGSIGNYITAYFDGSTMFGYYHNQTAKISFTAPGTGWHHFAVVRYNGDVKCYIDGTQAGSTYNATNDVINTESFAIGANDYTRNGAHGWEGHIDEIRFSDVARYTGSFTPSTTAFENDSNTLLLLHAEEGVDGTTEIFDDNGQTMPTRSAVAYGEDASPYLSILTQVSNDVEDVGSAASNPSGKPYSINYSTDGVYMVVGISASPYCEIYKISGSTYTKLTSPFNTAPSSQVWQAQFSEDGNYLYMSTSSSPFFYAYSRSGDSFTKLSNPGNLPTAQARGCAVWGDYIAIAQLSYGTAQGGGNNVHLYKNTSGSISRVDVKADAAGRMINCAWSHDGVYLGVTMNDYNPRYAIYKRSGDSLTLLTTPLSVGATNAGRGLAFDPTGQYLAFMSNDTDSLRFYKKDSGADTWTYLEAKTIGVWDNHSGAWSKDGRYFFCASQTSPYFYAYERRGDTFVLLTSPTMPNGGTVGVYPNHYFGTA
jgi:hypothetical protein